MYKDKDKANEVAKERMRRYRERNNEGVTDCDVIPEMYELINTPEGKRAAKDLPANYGLDNCECKHCQQTRANKSKNIINHGEPKAIGQLAANEVNRVSLPGDVDYQDIQLGPCGSNPAKGVKEILSSGVVVMEG